MMRFSTLMPVGTHLQIQFNDEPNHKITYQVSRNAPNVFSVKLWVDSGSEERESLNSREILQYLGDAANKPWWTEGWHDPVPTWRY